MAGEISSPNMLLPVPGVGVTAGPQYAIDINACLAIIDQHNHSAGSGVQITPSGLNINSSFPINNQALTSIGSLQFQAQASSLATAALYCIGVDLYFNDGSGNVIRVTQGGTVAGSTGTITGLPSGTASASYSSGTFTFQAATNTPANIDGGSYIFRNNVASSKGLTLQPPNAMGSDYILTLPSIPAQTNVLTIDTSGNMGSVTWDQVGANMSSVGANAVLASVTTSVPTASNAIANARTRTVSSTVGVGGVALSPVANFTTTSLSNVAVTNLSVTITTSGRPLFLGLTADNSNTSTANVVCEGTVTGNGDQSSYVIFNEATGGIQTSYRLGLLNNGNVSGAQNVRVPSSAVNAILFPTAGTYTYNVLVRGAGGGTITTTFIDTKLIAYEL